MKIKNILMVSTVALLSMTACNDDAFLKENPKSIYTTDNAFNTADQVNACVTNLYVHIRYWYQIDNFWCGLGADVMDTPYFRCTGNGYSNFSNWSPTSSSSSKVFDAMYQLVNFANQTLEGYRSPNITWDDAQKKAEIYGQTMFFRGYGYLSLGELFGGVPLVDKYYDTLKLDFSRSSRAETYRFAINDLKRAAANLPKYPSEAGRVARGAAYHFLSEAYLALATINDNNAAQLDTAIAYADTVMAMHPLMTSRFGTRTVSGNVKNGVDSYYKDGNVFFDLFQEGNYDYSEGNTEAVWTIENDYTVYHQYGGDNYVPSPRNASPVLRDATWGSAYKNVGGGAGPWASNINTSDYPGGNVSAYLGGRGTATYSPTDYVIEQIWKNDDGDIRNAPCNIRRNFVCTDTKSKMYGKACGIDMLDATSQKITEFYPIWTKFAPVDDWGYDDLTDGGDRSNMYCDRYAVRSAETLLLRAEEKLRKGDKAGAAADVNILRRRAQCKVMATASEMDLQYILDERARELYGEERRWATLLRMGSDGIKSINDHAMYIVDQPYWKGYFKASQQPITKWTLWPIPQADIDGNSDAKITQNPGW